MRQLRWRVAGILLLASLATLAAVSAVVNLGGGAAGEEGSPGAALPVAVLVAVLVSALLAWPLIRTVRHPFEQLRDALDELLHGRAPQPLPWHGRDLLGVVARNVQELGERSQDALAEVTAEKERLQAVLQGMTEGVLVLDPDGRIELVNRRLRDLFGVWGRVAGRPPLEVIRRDEIDEALRRARSSPEPVSCEVRLGGDEPRHVRMHAVRFPITGPVLGTVAVFHDLTEVRRLEGVRQDFVANVSHELKTPLTAIRGFAETLQQEGLEPVQRQQFTGVILRHAERLTALIEDLLELSRIEGRRQFLRPTEVDLALLCRALVRDLKPRFEAAALLPRVEVRGDMVALADRRAVEQVLLNLLDNAIKYTDPGGHVTLVLQQRGERVQVEVVDDGMGIPPEDQARIFERFYRVDKARSRDLGGTGLGLSIVKHLVQAMGGEVRVESQPGQGTRFRFTLPWAGALQDKVTAS